MAGRLLSIIKALIYQETFDYQNIAKDTLCQRIASPAGTTEAALRTLHEREVASAAKQAVKAAYKRALELSV
ncbi:pyrroline-5-carboxylate reductase dimerization domain-containing protein [Marinomonas sp.]|uniref:pyrroline-5-carboxylate reductase dimerization domain-containing protein n=1 Tax=Marinomonas sp. TaxID=1904862 RepID=UPI003A8E5F41